MAGSTGAIRAGRAFIEIGANTNPLIKGLKFTTKKLNEYASRAAGMGRKLFAAGAAILAPIGAAIISYAKTGDELGKMSARTGATTQALSEMGFAAEQTGSDIKTLENGFKGMDKFLLNAERGLSTAKDTMDDLGVSLSDFSGMSPDQKLEHFADKISEIEDPGKRAALAMQVFGRAGQQLLPLLNGGAASIRALRAEAQDLGLSVSPEEAKAAEDFNDAWNRVVHTVKSAGRAVAVGIIPTLTELSKLVLDNSQVVLSWIRDNKWAVMAAAGTGAALFVLGGAVLGVALGFKVAAIAVGVLTTVLGAVLSPMGLLIAGLAALVYYSGAGGKALDWLSSRFGWLGEFASETFGDIKQALNAGEFKLAAQLLWASVKHVWYRGTNDLFDNISEWKKSFLEIWDGAIDHASSYFIDEWAMLQTAWVKITQFFGDAWDIVVNSIVDKWKNAQNYIADTALDVILALDPSINKEDARAELQEMQEREKQSRSSALNNRILERDQQTQAELKEIEDARQGAQQANAEESQRKADMREQELKQARAERERRLAQTSEEIAAIRNEISLLPKPEETNLGQTAAAGGGGVKSTAAFKASTTAKAGGDGPVNLRSEAGVKLLADLFNDSGQDKTLKELETSNGLLGEIAAVLDARLLRTAGA